MAAPPLRCPGQGTVRPGPLVSGLRPGPAACQAALCRWTPPTPRPDHSHLPGRWDPKARLGQPGTLLRSARAGSPAAPRRPAQWPPKAAPGSLRPAPAPRGALCGQQPARPPPAYPSCPPSERPLPHPRPPSRREDGAQPSPPVRALRAPGPGSPSGPGLPPCRPLLRARPPRPRPPQAPASRPASRELTHGEPSLAHAGPGPGSRRRPGPHAPPPRPPGAGPGARLPALTRHLLPPAAIPAPRSSPGSEPLPWAWRPGRAAECVQGLRALPGAAAAPPPPTPRFHFPLPAAG